MDRSRAPSSDSYLRCGNSSFQIPGNKDQMARGPEPLFGEALVVLMKEKNKALEGLVTSPFSFNSSSCRTSCFLPKRASVGLHSAEGMLSVTCAHPLIPCH